MEDFEQELKLGFLEEATQLLSDVEQCFLLLESNPEDRATLEKIFRLAHNLKGSAKAVGFLGLGEFTHELESFLLKLKDGTISVCGSSIALLLRCNDHVSKMVEALKNDLSANPEYADLMHEIRSAMSDDVPPTATVDDVEVAQPEMETPQEVVMSQPQVASPSAQPSGKSTSQGDESIRVSLARLEKLLNYVGEIVILQTVLREQSYSNNASLLRKTVHQMGKVTKEVQDLSMSLRMVPIKQTFQKMQRIVRDTSASLEKKVSLVLQGEETEVDKTILENLSDPLVHLIRNAVDHGIESTEGRTAAGKSPIGTVQLSARHQNGNLIIEIIDDGAGMDPERLRQKAIEKGILKPGQTLPDREAYKLVFHPGFSTKAVVTDVSGRGVGMDVVKTNIERLQGEVQIETTLGKGTCFRVCLPLTLAIIDGMIIRSNEERYVIPLSHVHESLRPAKEDVHFVTGLGEVLFLRGEKIPLFRLDSILSPQVRNTSIQESTVIVVRNEQRVFSVLVDDIIGQHQVVIKQLGQEHRDLKGLSGSAILGDGRPALILELDELVKKAKPRAAMPTHEPRKGTA